MPDLCDILRHALPIGSGATLVMDLWALLRARAFGVPSLDYALVGRWVGHMARGRFRHAPITASAPVRGERALGWLAHYAIGVAFAALLVAAQPGWAREPTLLPALAAGLASLVAPFLVMQPAMGFGIAAARAPLPDVARRRSLATHLVFGLGLYLAACAAACAA